MWTEISPGYLYNTDGSKLMVVDNPKTYQIALYYFPPGIRSPQLLQVGNSGQILNYLQSFIKSYDQLVWKPPNNNASY